MRGITKIIIIFLVITKQQQYERETETSDGAARADANSFAICRVATELDQRSSREGAQGRTRLLLQKNGLKRKELVDAQVGMWMAGNLDLLTADEKKQFPHLVF